MPNAHATSSRAPDSTYYRPSVWVITGLVVAMLIALIIAFARVGDRSVAPDSRNSDTQIQPSTDMNNDIDNTP